MKTKTKLVLIVFILFQPALHADSLNGFVTRVNSPSDFIIGNTHVVLSSKTTCVNGIAKLYGESKRGYLIWGIFSGGLFHKRYITCNKLNILLYSRVQVYGSMRVRGKTFIARKLIAYNILPNHAILQDGAVLEEAPALSKSGLGWNGRMWIDGYPILVTAETVLISEEPGTHFCVCSHILQPYFCAKTKSKDKKRTFPSLELKQNTSVAFRAVHTRAGSILAAEIRYWPNWVDSKENDFDSRFVLKIHLPNYIGSIPGVVQYQGAEPIAILPNKEIQDWAANLGKSLIPSYQKNLLYPDPTKIHFRFFVIQGPSSRLGKHFFAADGGTVKKYLPIYQIEYWDRSSNVFYCKPGKDFIVRGIIAAPDGTILIPDVVLEEFSNTAQLATLLSAAITSIVQKQDYYSRPSFVRRWNASPYGGCGDTDFSPWFNEQALRIGIRQMYLAGYDIREAPYAWAVAQGKPVQNPVINSKHPDQEIPWYAAYAFNYISQYYRDVDYSKLKRGKREYQQFLQELYKADPSLPRPKARLEPQAQLESQPQLKLQAQPRPVCTPTQAAKDAACMGHSATQGTAQPTPQSSATPANFAPKQAPAQAATAH